METNPDLVLAAKKLVETPGELHLPVEIPEFTGVFVAAADDDSISIFGAFVASDGRSYKIGT